jgi:hypothetical protein
MSFDDYRIESYDELEKSSWSPMTPGQHVCRVIEVGKPRTKTIQVWYEGRLDAIDVKEVMVRFADDDDPSQTICDYFKLPTEYPYSADRFVEGKDNQRDRNPNFHFRKIATFLGKLGFGLENGQVPREAWNPSSWLDLDIALTVQPQRPKATNASQMMEGVPEAQSTRMEVRLFSYKLTANGLQRQANRGRSGVNVPDANYVPF